MNLKTLLEKTTQAIESGSYRLQNEDKLQNQISQILEKAQISHEREAILSPKNRIDFLLAEGLGIEVKINRSGTALLKQIERYCLDPRISHLIVVTIRPTSLPKILHNTPISGITLWNRLCVF